MQWRILQFNSSQDGSDHHDSQIAIGSDIYIITGGESSLIAYTSSNSSSVETAIDGCRKSEDSAGCSNITHGREPENSKESIGSDDYEMIVKSMSGRDISGDELIDNDEEGE